MADPGRMQDEWKSPVFRNKIVTRLDEAMRNSQSQISKSGIEMEDFVFNKAKSREEYMDLVARVLLTVSDQNKDKKLGQPGMVPPNMGPAGMAGAMRTQVMQGQDQDPINALQNLAGQGTGGMGRPQQGGMMPGMHGLPGPGNQQQGQMVRQSMMQHARPGMQQRPPQLHDAFMVTSPQSMPGVPGQPMHTTSQGMGYPGPGTARTMVPMNMQGGYMPVRDVNMQGPGMPIQSPATGSPLAMVPSPHVMMVSPAMRMGAPSPNTMLHTPGTTVVEPSPGPPSTSQEEVEYVKKLDKLSRYIEPLRNFIMDLEKKNDEGLFISLESKKNHKKMKSLLDILSNPKKRVPMVVLEKCEQVLLKLTINPSSSSAHGHMCQPLLDAVAHFSAASLLNHSLYRTFGPALEAYMGPPIISPSPPASRKRKAEEAKETPDELPDLVQGEIARLGSRFIVSVDPRHHSRSDAFHLVCKLEEPLLPSVPPLLVTVPKAYPGSSPQCDPASCPGYDSTEFFQNVEKNLSTHLCSLPNRFCLTQLLRAWEMSVRKATDPVSPLIAQPCPIFA
ncbi:hypothetical protein BsWGS_21999 [Bradybaena similaris]